MVKVAAKSETKDVQNEAYKRLAAELTGETRKEQGCISYELFRDVEHPNIFTFIETWEDQDALDRHMKSAHFQRIVPQMAPLREKASEINVYRPVLYFKSLRKKGHLPYLYDMCPHRLKSIAICYILPLFLTILCMRR